MRTILIIDDPASTHTDELMRELAEAGGCRLLYATAPRAVLPASSRLPAISEVLAAFNRRYDLTRRQCELMLYQVRAPKATHAELAAQARLTRNSVKTYFKRIYRKLGITADDDAGDAAGDMTRWDNRTGRKRMTMLRIFQQHFPLAVPSLQVREVGDLLMADRWADVA